MKCKHCGEEIYKSVKNGIHHVYEHERSGDIYCQPNTVATSAEPTKPEYERFEVEEDVNGILFVNTSNRHHLALDALPSHKNFAGFEYKEENEDMPNYISAIPLQYISLKSKSNYNEITLQNLIEDHYMPVRPIAVWMRKE